MGVVFSIPLNEDVKLDESDFSVTAKINDESSNKSSLLLKLDKVPSSVYNARLLEKEVQYVLIK